MLTGAAKLAGVIGWPVSHSRSPRLHGHWLARHNVDGAYLPLAVHPDNLETAVKGLRAAGFRGVNITIPHKVAVLDLCTELESSAIEVGAANTLVFTEAGIIGSNTDGHGFLANLKAHGASITGSSLILGGGGGARAIAAALLAAGAQVTVANRTHSRAETLAQTLPDLEVVPWADRSKALVGKTLLINTTQLGMTGQPALEIDLQDAQPDLTVADIVYAPLQTPLLRAAQARGLRSVTGIGMLLHQAVPGFSQWFGVTPVVDQALEDAVLA